VRTYLFPDNLLVAADLEPKEGYKRVHMLEVAKANTLDRAVAVIVCGKVHLTPKGVKELQALKEQYGSKPCEHCRFYDGGCVLGEPEVCR